MIDKAEQDSALATAAFGHQLMLQEAMRFHLDYMGLEVSGEEELIKLNVDFRELSYDPAMISSLHQLRIAGDISQDLKTGFLVGANTLVSPTMVAIGPLPMFPLLAALPDNGPTPAWTAYLMAVPLLVAAFGAARSQRRNPTLRWDEGALRGCGGGVLAGVVLAALAAVSGGAVGPGRMREVGPLGLDVLVHAITAFGIGGLIGGLAMTWWQRRAARHHADPSEPTS